MNSTAKKCIYWAIGLWIAGAVLLIYMPDIYLAVADRAGANAEFGLRGLNIALVLVNSTLIPVGAALVGAAVVIQVMTKNAPRTPQDSVYDRNRNA